MINSKALKSTPKRLMTEACGCPEGDAHDCSRLKKLMRAAVRAYMFKVFYPVESFFSRLKERIGRSLSWARFTYLNYDFDSAYLYSVMSFKLRRLHKCLENGHAVQEKVDMDALKEAIAVCDRLFSGNYDDKYHREHDKKWGKLPRFRTKPIKNEKGKVTHYQMVHRERSKVKTEKDKKQERKDFLNCYHKGEADRRKDIDLLAHLLKEHAPKWWD